MWDKDTQERKGKGCEMRREGMKKDSNSEKYSTGPIPPPPPLLELVLESEHLNAGIIR